MAEYPEVPQLTLFHGMPGACCLVVATGIVPCFAEGQKRQLPTGADYQAQREPVDMPTGTESGAPVLVGPGMPLCLFQPPPPRPTQPPSPPWRPLPQLLC